eukprot:gene19467-23310_t
MVSFSKILTIGAASVLALYSVNYIYDEYEQYMQEDPFTEASFSFSGGQDGDAAARGKKSGAKKQMSRQEEEKYIMNYQNLRKLGEEYLQEEDLEMALNVFEEMLDCVNKSPSLLQLDRGQTLIMVFRLASAIKNEKKTVHYAQKLIDFHGPNPQGQKLDEVLGLYELIVKDHIDAKRYKEAIEIVKGWKRFHLNPEQIINQLSILATVQRKDGNIEEWKSLVHKAVAVARKMNKTPALLSTMVDLIDVYATEKNEAEMVKATEEALPLVPGEQRIPFLKATIPMFFANGFYEIYTKYQAEVLPMFETKITAKMDSQDAEEVIKMKNLLLRENNSLACGYLACGREEDAMNIFTEIQETKTASVKDAKQISVTIVTAEGVTVPAGAWLECEFVMPSFAAVAAAGVAAVEEEEEKKEEQVNKVEEKNEEPVEQVEKVEEQQQQQVEEEEKKEEEQVKKVEEQQPVEEEEKKEEQAAEQEEEKNEEAAPVAVAPVVEEPVVAPVVPSSSPSIIIRKAADSKEITFDTIVESGVDVEQAFFVKIYVLPSADSDRSQAISQHFQVISPQEPALGYIDAIPLSQLIEDLFDSKSIAQSIKIFSFLESRAEFFSQDSFVGNSRAKNIILKICIELLRRLSRSTNPEPCGRILIFLAYLFPLSDPSGLNAKSVNNIHKDLETLDMTSLIEYEESNGGGGTVDLNFYKQFWGLQTYFQNPYQLFVGVAPSAIAQGFIQGTAQVPLTLAKDKWTHFTESLDLVLTTFATAINLDELAATPSTHYFTKYLTSANLMKLQLKDATFRRNILTQLLITFQFIEITAAKNPTVLGDTHRAAITNLASRAYKIIAATPPNGQHFADCLAAALKREANWISWKRDTSCRSFERPSCQPIVVKRRKTKRVDPTKISMGNPELSRLWNLSVDNAASLKTDVRPSLDTYVNPLKEEHSQREEAARRDAEKAERLKVKEAQRKEDSERRREALEEKKRIQPDYVPTEEDEDPLEFDSDDLEDLDDPKPLLKDEPIYVWKTLRLMSPH